MIILIFEEDTDNETEAFCRLSDFNNHCMDINHLGEISVKNCLQAIASKNRKMAEIYLH